MTIDQNACECDYRGTDADQLLRLDYEQTTQLVRTLSEIRFKLLAFVPTIAGASVAVMSSPDSAVALLAIGSLGLVATLGIFLYEIRNSQLHAAAVHRARFLEGRLALPAVDGGVGAGGPFSDRPARALALFRAVGAWHDRGLALVYAASLAGWSYLVAWGAFAATGVPEPRAFGGVAAAVVGVLVLVEVERLDVRAETAPAAAASPRERGSGIAGATTDRR